ncbi:MAPEG family protein [Roseibium sp. SCP14]|uniref:MAPEG family protein n=1 Tax=Roseibium sp. SCP14 TaxID=3141375 RepID=UPI0033379961
MDFVQDERRQRARFFILAYPFALIAISLVLNVLLFGIHPIAIALPSKPVIIALVIAAVLLLANHTWLMTTTELTRVKFGMYATPEEWQASGRKREDTAPKGLEELERRHNAHRNSTENTVYFVLLVLVFSVTSPADTAAVVWIAGFGAARLGYSFSYLTGRDGLRGLFMSLSLLCLYGLASYAALAVIA